MVLLDFLGSFMKGGLLADLLVDSDDLGVDVGSGLKTSLLFSVLLIVSRESSNASSSDALPSDSLSLVSS